MEPPISLEEEDMNNDPEVCDPSSNDEGSVVEQEEVPEPPQQIEHEVVVTADAAPVAQEDAPKKSYASIVSYFFFLHVWYFGANRVSDIYSDGLLFHRLRCQNQYLVLFMLQLLL